jgi:glycosyltransferase involved in cell wall biosynthesis
MEQSEIIRRLQSLDEYAFEKFVADLWEKRGWNTTVTTKSNDRGIDIEATQTIPYEEKELIQAKRYQRGNRVGSRELQQYAALHQQEAEADKVIVVDDGSTDHSERVIRRWADTDERVQYVYQENQGPSVARNHGVNEARGSLIAFLDADDVWKSEKLRVQVSFLQDHSDVALVCSDYIEEKKGDRRRIRAQHLDYRQDDLLESLYLRGGPVMMSTVVLRRHVFKELGGFTPAILKGQDTDLWLRVAAKHPIHHLPTPLVIKRVREGSVGSDMVEKVQYLRKIADRFAEKYSRLAPLRDRRHGILSEFLARHWIRRGNRREAQLEAIRALRTNPGSVKALLLVVLSLLPFSSEWIDRVLTGLGEIRQRVTSLKAAVGRRK